MFEVQDLKYATLATVSRCGMVWFSEDVLSTDMIFNNFLARLRSIPLDEGEDEAQRRRKSKEDEGEEAASPMLQVGGHGPGARGTDNSEEAPVSQLPQCRRAWESTENSCSWSLCTPMRDGPFPVGWEPCLPGKATSQPLR